MDAWLVIILVLSALVLSYGVISYIFAQITLNPRRQPVVASPADLGMNYEDVEFRSLDGLRLRGWFIPGDPRKLLLMTHPLFCNRHGFLVKNKSVFMATKTNINFLPAMKAFNDAGYSILTFDFRNHGASEHGLTGVGMTEYQDVLGAVEYLKQRPELAEAALGLVGFCMGANSMILALSRDPAQFARARCLIAVQPISMDVFVRSYMRSNFGWIGLTFLPMVNLIRQWLGGYPFKVMSPGKYIKDITTPTLYVQGKVDPWTEVADIQNFYDTTVAPKDFWWLDTDCRPEAYQYVSEHPQRLIDFLNRHLSNTVATEDELLKEAER
jgi:pimeloyl-ACP methyl ester carboxylesterase